MFPLHWRWQIYGYVLDQLKHKAKGLPWRYSGKESACRCRRQQVGSLIQKDHACSGAVETMSHNYWDFAVEPGSHNPWAHMLQLLKPEGSGDVLHRDKPPQWEAHALQLESSPCLLQLEKSPCSSEYPAQLINKFLKIKKCHKADHFLFYINKTQRNLSGLVNPYVSLDLPRNLIQKLNLFLYP